MFKINLYKQLKKYPLLKHSNKSMHYFKNFFQEIKLICQIKGDQFKKYSWIKMLYFFKLMPIYLGDWLNQQSS